MNIVLVMVEVGPGCYNTKELATSCYLFVSDRATHLYQQAYLNYGELWIIDWETVSSSCSVVMNHILLY